MVYRIICVSVSGLKAKTGVLYSHLVRFFSDRQAMCHWCGLISGSLARDLKRLGACREVVGCSRNQDNQQRALDLGVIDSFSADITSATEGANMVVLAVPLEAMQGFFESLARCWPHKKKKLYYYIVWYRVIIFFGVFTNTKENWIDCQFW